MTTVIQLRQRAASEMRRRRSWRNSGPGQGTPRVDLPTGGQRQYTDVGAPCIVDDAEYWDWVWKSADSPASDKAFAQLVRTKRDALKGFGDLAPEAWKERLLQALKDVPADGANCECCGYAGLIHIRRKGTAVVGPECTSPDHEFGSCRRGAR